jgi:hypothetical protein
VTPLRVVRSIRREQHRVAVLEHLSKELLSSLTTAYDDEPRLVVSINGVAEQADDRVVEQLQIELAKRAEQAKRDLVAMLERDVTQMVFTEDEEGDDGGEKLFGEVVSNPRLRKERDR